MSVDLESILHAFVTTRLNYYDTLFAPLPTVSSQSLKWLQDTAAGMTRDLGNPKSPSSNLKPSKIFSVVFRPNLLKNVWGTRKVWLFIVLFETGYIGHGKFPLNVLTRLVLFLFLEITQWDLGRYSLKHRNCVKLLFISLFCESVLDIFLFT